MQGSSVRRRRGPRRSTLAASVLAAVVAVSPLPLLTGAASAQTPTGLDAAGVVDLFDTVAPGARPPGWTQFGTGGTATVETFPEPPVENEVLRGVRLRDTSPTEPVTLDKDLGGTRAPVHARFRLRAEQTTAVVGVHLDTAAGHAVTLGMSARGDLYTYDGAAVRTLGKYRANTWYDVRIVAEPGLGTARIDIDGDQRAAGLRFRQPVAPFTNLQVGVEAAGTGTAWVDEVRVDAEPTPAGFRQIGTVEPRDVEEIGAGSPFIAGGETTDRGFTSYPEYKEYLTHLGSDRSRVSGGWNEVENNDAGREGDGITRQNGVFDPAAPFDPLKARYRWNRLDTQINGLVEQGITPVLQVSYGNWHYDGGNVGLGGPLPRSVDAHTNFVREMVKRYAGRVEWEMWNEVNKGNTALEYSAFIQRVGGIIRTADPDARIWTSTYGIDLKYVGDFLQDLEDKGEVDLVDVVAYHPYDEFPDNPAIYRSYVQLQNLVKGFSPSITVAQNESGLPSCSGSVGFGGPDGGNLNPTHYSQRVYNLRRVVGDIGVGVPSGLVGTADMWYDWNPADPEPKLLNCKGLLTTRRDNVVTQAKSAYYALRNVTSLFDNTLKPLTSLRDVSAPQSPITGYPYTHSGGRAVTLRAFEKDGTRQQAVVLWHGGDWSKPASEKAPSEDRTTAPVAVTLENANIADPVYVQIGTGAVFEFPEGSVVRNGSRYTFDNLPLGNEPIAVMDRSLAQLS